jgi:agmatinase
MYDSYLDLQGESGQEILVWPVPYDATASFAQGARNGPQAILRASYEIETWDEELGADMQDQAHFPTLPFFRHPVGGPEQMVRGMLDELESGYDARRDFFLVLGGEHTVALAPIRFYSRAYPDLVVLQLDAHADLRLEFQSSPYSHASVMARVMEMDVTLVQLGVRSLSRSESGRIRHADPAKLRTFFAWDLPDPKTAARRIGKIARDRPLYVSFDADALDPSIMPGTGTPEPGGIGFQWLNDFWPALFEQTRLVGMDFCELLPLPASGVVSESVAVRCINRVLLSHLLATGA